MLKYELMTSLSNLEKMDKFIRKNMPNSPQIDHFSNEIKRRIENGLSENGRACDRRYDDDAGYYWASMMFNGKKYPIEHEAVECVFSNTRQVLVNPNLIIEN